MESRQQPNGNTQLNGVRDSFNSNVSKLSMLGATKKVQWDDRRRNRAI
jgi:hypothetical protein